MCEEGIRDASGWDVLCAAQRFQHRVQVSMDQCLHELGISFAQYRILELLAVARDLSLSELGRRVGRTRLRLFRRATGSVLATFESEFAHARRSSIVMLLGKAELALETPEPRPWWLNE